MDRIRLAFIALLATAASFAATSTLHTPALQLPAPTGTALTNIQKVIIQPNEAASAPLGIGQMASQNPGTTTRSNQHLSFGYNYFNNTRVIATEPALNFNIESHYVGPTETDATALLEWYVAYLGTNSASQTRPIGGSFVIPTGFTYTQIQGDTVSITTPGSTANKLVLYNGYTHSPSPIYVGIDSDTPGGNGTGAIAILPYNDGVLGDYDLRKVGSTFEYYQKMWALKGWAIMVANGTRGAKTAVTPWVTTNSGAMATVGYPVFYDGTANRLGAFMFAAVTTVTNNASVGSELQFWTGTASGNSALCYDWSGLQQSMTVKDDGAVQVANTVNATNGFKIGSIVGITTTWTNMIPNVITQRISTIGGIVVTNLTL